MNSKARHWLQVMVGCMEKVLTFIVAYNKSVKSVHVKIFMRGGGGTILSPTLVKFLKTQWSV